MASYSATNLRTSVISSRTEAGKSANVSRTARISAVNARSGAALRTSRGADHPADPRTTQAIEDLLGLYLAERDDIEQRLIDASIARGFMACVHRPASGTTIQSQRDYRLAMEHAVTRRDWYGNQIKLLTNGDG